MMRDDLLDGQGDGGIAGGQFGFSIRHSSPRSGRAIQSDRAVSAIHASHGARWLEHSSDDTPFAAPWT